MPSGDNETRLNIRQTIAGLLRTLSDGDELREYGTRLGNAVGEIYCQWFDDVYHPDDLQFRSAFSPDMLDALARVNSALVSADESRQGREVEFVLGSSSCQAVQSAARRALQVFNE